MGLINKLKNVLFEETEIDEPENEEFVEQKLDEKIEKAKMSLPKINRDSRKKEEKTKIEKKEEYDFEDEPDHELFKMEKTFNFPDFDEDEFEDFIPKKKEEPKKVQIKEENEYKSRFNKENNEKKVFSSTRVIKTMKEEPKKAFKPSPVISPVYGILDKNYKKEDIITKEEKTEKDNIKLDVDSVRKKAFGALEEDLASTIENEPVVNFYGDIDESIEEEKVNNLLEDSVDSEIDVTKEMELPIEEEFGSSIQDELEDSDEIDEIFANTKDKLIEEDSTDDANIEKEIIDKEIEENIEDSLGDESEDDLFELIDSMYENKEEE